MSHRKTNKLDCAPSKETKISQDIRKIWSVSSLSVWRNLPIERTAKTLIRLGGCPGWSESSLGTQSFSWFYHEAATKPTNWIVRPAKTKISQSIRQVWSVSSLGGCPGWSESSLGAQSFSWFYHEVAQMTTTWRLNLQNHFTDKQIRWVANDN